MFRIHCITIYPFGLIYVYMKKERVYIIVFLWKCSERLDPFIWLSKIIVASRYLKADTPICIDKWKYSAIKA